MKPRLCCLQGISILLTTLFVFSLQPVQGQIWKKIQNAAKGIGDAARQVTNTSKQLNSTVKTVKQTWKKDTSRNIRYEQIPDYRSREEVQIRKKQELTIENGEFQNLTWSPVVNFHNQIFPSFVISWEYYGGVKEVDMGSSLGFKIETNLSNVVLKWEIESKDKTYFDIDSGYINCNYLKNGNLFLPKIGWNFRALAKHQSSAPINIYFRLIDPNTGEAVEKKVTATLRSIDDCMTWYNGVSYKKLYAAFANEEHPEIEKIMKEMLQTKIVSEIIGNQQDGKKVEPQMAALWRVFHDRGFQYSTISKTAHTNTLEVSSQAVRTFDNALKSQQANCIDGTLMMASVMKRIGMRPMIVLVYGHAFLGYYSSNDESAGINYLETTMISDNEFIKNPKAAMEKYKFLLKLIPPDLVLSDLNKAYYMQFLAARFSGDQRYLEEMKGENAKLVQRLDMYELRETVKPIPYYKD